MSAGRRGRPRDRDFLRLWAGAGANLLAVRVGAITYPLLALSHTGSTRAAGLVMFAVLLPNLVVQLPAGVLVDRYERRRLMVWCDVGCVLVTASVAVALTAGAFQPAHLVGAAFVQGALCVVHRLAEQSAVPHVVAAGELPAALGRNEARSRAAALLGQPVGSVLLAAGRTLPFLFVTAAHLLSLLLLLGIRKNLQDDRDAAPEPVVAAMRSGARWLFARPFLRSMVLLLSASNIVFQAITLALMEIIVRGHGSVAVVGVITALSGLGGMAGALSGRWWTRRISLRALIIGGFAVWSVVIAAVAVSVSPVLLALLYTLVGYVGGAVNVTGSVYLVRVTPDALLGRVNSVALLVGTGPAAAGSLVAGLLIDAAGTTLTVLGMSVAMGVLTAVAVLSPSLRAQPPAPETPDVRAAAQDRRTPRAGEQHDSAGNRWKED
jgi:MFS family permease